MKKIIYLIFICIYLTTFSWGRCCGMTAEDCNMTLPPTYNEDVIKRIIKEKFVGDHEIVDGGLILKAPLDPVDIKSNPLSIKSSVSIKTITIFSFNDLNEAIFNARINIPNDLPIEYIDYELNIKLNLTDYCKGGAIVVIGEGLDEKLYFNKHMILGCY